ncbi:beta-1,6-N-acetylglucosaminyltransferase, partial [Paracoccus sp. (in: a-proteobacteria)]|uniref:beta-1,6-N-acetylglucosaminyltransferase n=1 Tax=Paracoccus sp. TaxID=267 RepID=UPI003A8BE0B3
MTAPAVTLPVHLGVILLCHADLDSAAGLARIWATGGARVMIHVDSKAPAADVARMRAALAELDGIAFSPRRHCEWGGFSLVEATQEAGDMLLRQWPDCSHVFLASGSCLPLRPVQDLIAFLNDNPGRDFIESVSAGDMGWTVGGLNEERFTLYFPFDWRRRRWFFDRAVALQRRLRIRRKLPDGLLPHLGSQWWCLTAGTLRAILTDPRRASFDRFFRQSWIPDESYFQSLARCHSAHIESRSLTFARFDDKGRPCQLYDDHIPLL